MSDRNGSPDDGRTASPAPGHTDAPPSNLSHSLRAKAGCRTEEHRHGLLSEVIDTVEMEGGKLDEVPDAVRKAVFRWLRNSSRLVQFLVVVIVSVGLAIAPSLEGQIVKRLGSHASGTTVPSSTIVLPPPSTTPTTTLIGPSVKSSLPGHTDGHGSAPATTIVITTTTAPPSKTYDKMCTSPEGGVTEPGDGAPKGAAAQGLWALILGPNGYGAVIAGCVTAAEPEPGHSGWYQEGFRDGQLLSVATWSPSYPAAIAVGGAAIEADELLHDGTWVAISSRQYKGRGDAQMLWTAQGSYLFARDEESNSYTMLPPGATQAWDQESRQLGAWLWPIQGTPTNDSPLVFDLMKNPIAPAPAAVLECADMTCSSYRVGANSTPRKASNSIVNLNQLAQLP